MIHFSKHFLFSTLATVLLASTISYADANNILYRYKNHDGVQVINSFIPAKYAQLGYEIISFSGEVIETVPPAPTKDAIEKANKERAMVNAYAVLKKRYSEISDIERAKKRKLENINTSISILNGTIKNLQSSIDGLVSQAAEQERAGRKVPKTLLDQLADTKQELKVSQDLRTYREQEHREMAKKYDEDILTFMLGEKMKKELEARESAQ